MTLIIIIIHKAIVSQRLNLRHESPDCNQTFKQSSHLKLYIEIHTCEKPIACPGCDKKFTLVKSRSSVMIVTRRLNDVMARFTLHWSPWSVKNRSPVLIARLQGNDKWHFQCLLALCLYRDTAVFLVYTMNAQQPLFWFEGRNKKWENEIWSLNN